MVDFLKSSSAIAATKDKTTVLSPGDLGGVPRLNPVALDVGLTPDFLRKSVSSSAIQKAEPARRAATWLARWADA